VDKAFVSAEGKVNGAGKREAELGLTAFVANVKF
jgi:hypothetical protein